MKAVMEVTALSVNKLNIDGSLQVLAKKMLTQFWIIWVFTLFYNFTIWKYEQWYQRYETTATIRGMGTSFRRNDFSDRLVGQALLMIG